MFATDFLFNNQRASDLGLIVCTFDAEPQTASGGEITVNSVKTPGRDRFTFYNSQMDSVLVWNFSIAKNPSCHKNLYFNQYEERAVAQWLLGQNGYRWLQFDQEGYEDIFYRVYFNMTPHQISGQTAGFDLTATSDCGYGFSELLTCSGTVKSSSPMRIHVQSDLSAYILPYIKINANGAFSIYNESDSMQNLSVGKETKLNINGEITMNCDSNIITGLSAPDKFNWYFLRLVNGENIIKADTSREGAPASVNLTVQYREPRRVIV